MVLTCRGALRQQQAGPDSQRKSIFIPRENFINLLHNQKLIQMNQKTSYLLASLSCLVLLFLFAFMGQPGIVFQSIWGEIFVFVLLFLGAGVFLWAAFQKE